MWHLSLFLLHTAPTVDLVSCAFAKICYIGNSLFEIAKSFSFGSHFSEHFDSIYVIDFLLLSFLSFLFKTSNKSLFKKSFRPNKKLKRTLEKTHLPSDTEKITEKKKNQSWWNMITIDLSLHSLNSRHCFVKCKGSFKNYIMLKLVVFQDLPTICNTI